MLQFAGDYPCFLPASASTLQHHRYDNDGKELLHKPRALHSLQVGVMPHVRVHTNHGRWNGRKAGEADSETACQEMENVLKFDENWNAAAVAVVAMDVSSSSKMAGLEGSALPGVSCPSVSEERGERGAAERGVLAKLKGMQSWLRLWPTVSTKEVFVTIQDSLRHHYVWEGWGTSLCWWANFAGGLPKQDMDSVLDLLFDHAKGLGLNIVRYNIGGGSNPAFDTNMRPFADIPGFRPGGPSTPYDWTADERQRNILLGAMERGVTITEAFSNSPPFWMTISGSVTGNIGWGKDNLHPNYYDAFVDYLTTIVKHFEEAWGIHFDTISPFNEPVEGWWNIDRRKKSQEGCNFSIPTISKVLLSLQKALDEQNISTKISALDSWSQNTCQVLLRMEEDCLKAIHQVNVHTYVNSPTREEDAQRQKVKQRMSLLGKKLWMSEYGPLNWVGEELDVALAVGKHITLDLNDLQPSAWCYWQALEVSGSSWGLLTAPFSYDKKPFVVSLRKQYFVMMHFTRWIRPGFQIFDNASLKDTLVIASNLSGSSLVLVGTNTSNCNKDIRVDLSDLAYGLVGTSIQVALFRTSAVENHVELPILYFDSPILFVRLALKSITTMLIS